jgi:hypothetical protein
MAPELKRLALSTLMLVFLVADTRASTPAADGTYYGCYQKDVGVLRVIDNAKQQCLANEVSVTWTDPHQEEARLKPAVVSALVAAAASLLVALFSLLTARTARALALSAEDAAKQTEVIRAKGLSAVEEVTFSVGKLLEVTRTMQLTRSSFQSVQEFIANFDEALHRFTDKFIDAYYKNLVYFDERLTNEFHAIREMLVHQPTSEEGLKHQLDALRSLLELVSGLARERYLPTVARPNASMERTHDG